MDKAQNPTEKPPPVCSNYIYYATSISCKLLTYYCRARRGALVRYGDFWYPAHLIQYLKPSKKWQIRWWRECSFNMVGIELESGPLMLVDESDVVDSLWGDEKAQRQVRVRYLVILNFWMITNGLGITQLGKWINAHKVPSVEDILSNPTSILYTREVNEALQPYVDSLQKLLRNPGPGFADVHSVPAMKWLAHGKRDPLRTLIPYTGNLSVIDRAQIANWFKIHIAINKNI